MSDFIRQNSLTAAQTPRLLGRLPQSEWLILTVIAVLVVVAVTYPVIFVVLRSVSTGNIGSSPTLHWIAELVASSRSRAALLNTVIYSAGSTALSMTLGVAIAFLTTRTDMPYRRVVASLSLLPMLIPPFVLVVGWVAIGDPHAGFINILASKLTGPRSSWVNVDSMPGIIWVTGLFLCPYVYLVSAAGFNNSDAVLEEAARISGAGRMRLLRTIILPLQRPALLGALLLVVILSAGDFIIPATLGLRANIPVLSSLIWENFNSFPAQPGLASAQGLLLAALGLFCIYLQRRGLRGDSRFAIIGGKSSGALTFHLGWLRLPLAVLGIVLGLTSSALPLFAVLSMAFMRYWTPFAFSAKNFTLENFHYIFFEYPEVWPSVQHSLLIAVLGASLCTGLAIALAWYVVRLKGVLSPLVEYAVVVPLGVPGIALSIGILNAWIRVPGGLYGTVWILLLACVTALVPITMQFVASALRGIHPDLEHASRIAGQSWAGTVRRVVLPLIRPALVGGWLLMYVLMLREISLVILLYNPSTVVLSVGLLDVWTSGFYPQLAVYSLLLMALSLIPVGLFWRWSRKRIQIPDGPR